MPSDATSILRIDTITNEVTTFGQVETTNDAEDCPLPEKNKWQVGPFQNLHVQTIFSPLNKEMQRVETQYIHRVES